VTIAYIPNVPRDVHSDLCQVAETRYVVSHLTYYTFSYDGLRRGEGEFRVMRSGTLLPWGPALLALPLAVAGCGDEPNQRAPLARVDVTTAEIVPFAPRVSLTGTIMAQVQNDLSFRVSGKIIERNVDIGDHVTADQILAKLDPGTQEADVEAAKAGVQSAEAQLKQATATYQRQKSLLDSGFTTRTNYDQAEQSFRTAQASLDSAHAQLASAQDRLSYTVLRAGAPGLITARFAELGQVVEPAKAIFTLAQDGPRDAVFEVYEAIFALVPEDVKVDIALVSDPKITAPGTVREIAPALDTNTGTVRVKVGIPNTPPAMTLGAIVTGSGNLRGRDVVILPWGALFEIDGKPAVWIVDPRDRTVSLKPIAVDAYLKDRIIVTDGLKSGDVVVTAGVQYLRPQQQVALAGEKAR
jgi:membrane fusion protein, multidrug efflux system